MKTNGPNLTTNKLVKSLLLLCCFAAVMSCKKSSEIAVETPDYGANRPFADYDVIPGDDPFTFKFENKSAKYKSLEWRFGDDSVSTEASPTHVYLSTGDFQVNLKTVGADGSSARKLLVLKLIPDSIVKINTTKLTESSIKFSLTSKATIAAVSWNFAGQTSTDMEPVRAMTPGVLYSFSVKVTTNKGSVINISKLVTTEGTVQDVTAGASVTVSKDNNGGPNNNEGSLKVLDNSVDTKWLTSNTVFPLYATYKLTSPNVVKIYSITSANDADARDPQQWEIQGSNDNSTWQTLDTRDVLFTARKQTQYFTIANPRSFLYYRWMITKNRGNNSLFQVAEWRVFK